MCESRAKFEDVIVIERVSGGMALELFLYLLQNSVI